MRQLPPLAWLLLCAAGAAHAGGAASPHPDRVLLSARDVGPGWEVVNEVPEPVAGDADFARWGVRDKRARHYTRRHAGGAEVCSIEVWRFRSAERAREARAGFAFPDWAFESVESLLLAAHGHRRSRDGALRGLFPECRTLFRRTAERAASLH